MKRSIVLFCIGLGLAACRGRETLVADVRAENAPVIIISVDTLRADHLPAYGYDKVETPALDALRKDSILYTNAWSHVPLTLPSHVSILTGLLPPDNGVRNNIGFPYDAAKHPAVTSVLKEKGYKSGAAVSAYVLRGTTGLNGVFDFYDDAIAAKEGEALGRLQRPGSESEQVAERWIAQQGDKPFFFMLHLFEPHTPYDAPEPFRSRFALPYDAEIAASDAVVGRFIDFLRRSGIYDRALIVFLSDHGEGLNDHGEDEHGIFLYREAIHVPLIVKLPKSQFAGATVAAPVQLVDIVPTITAVVGAKNLPGIAGRSLLEVANQPARRIYSETLYPRIHLGWSDLRSLVDDQFHYIEAPRPELYALSDTAERQNVMEANRRVLAAMRKDLEPFSREMPSLGNIDPEEAKKLAALGYLSSASSQSSGPLEDPKDRIGDLAMLRQANGYEKAGRSEEAVAIYRKVIERNPRLTDAWNLLAQLLEHTGKTEEAIATYKRAIQIAPSLAGEFSLSIANLYLVLNQPADAAANAEAGMKTNPPAAELIVGRAAMAQGDLTKAVAKANQVMQTYSYRPAGMVLMAQILVRQNKLAEALRSVDGALEDARSKKLDAPPLLHFVRGDVLARQNRVPEAIAEFEEEIRLFPRNRNAYANLTVVHLLAGRQDLADQTMERLVKANPDRKAYELAVTTFSEVGDQQSAARWRARMR